MMIYEMALWKSNLSQSQIIEHMDGINACDIDFENFMILDRLNGLGRSGMLYDGNCIPAAVINNNISIIMH